MKKLFTFYSLRLLYFLFVAAAIAGTALARDSALHTLHFDTAATLSDFFRYRENNPVIVSGHRGGAEPGYPENSLEGLENVLTQVPAFFELDPRLTRDSVIVLMHDATLERTTTGSGRVSDHTWAELQRLRLKDCSGRPTGCRIPTLEAVIEWSRGKTVINLDKKDVPLPMLANLISKHRAERHVMLTVHTGAQARYYYDRLPGVMLSAFIRNWKEYEDMELSGVPWSQIVAYVGPTMKPENRKLYDTLHAKGVRCMISVAPTHDRLPDAAQRRRNYREELARHPDIVETDRPAEVVGLLFPE